MVIDGGDEILFRCLTDPVASWTVPGIRWVLEYWKCGRAHPVGQAWVMLLPGGSAYLDWLYVMEGYRRVKIGTALLEAAKTRWPGLDYDAATELGASFLAGFEEGSGTVSDGSG